MHSQAYTLYKFAVLATVHRTAVCCRLPANWLVLLKQCKVLLKKFCAVGRDSFHSQRLRGVLNRGVKITNLSVRYSESVDHVLVLPYHNAARGLCVFYCLLPIAKRRVWASRPKPGTIAQHPGERHIPGMKRSEIIKFL